MSFGIKHLLVLIAVVAVGLAGLLNARWPAALVTVQLLAILIVVAMAYGAWFSTGAARAFRIGFLGWWLLYSVPILGLTLPSVATKALLSKAAPAFRPTDFAQPVVSAGSTLSISSYVPNASSWPPVNPGVQDTISVTLPADPIFAPTSGTLMVGTSANIPTFPLTGSFTTSDEVNWGNRYYAIGQCLAAILVGLCGGWLTAVLYRRRERRSAAA